MSIFITKANSLNDLYKYNSIINGCDGLVVKIRACGALDPGSIPGRGLTPFSFSLQKENKKLYQKERESR